MLTTITKIQILGLICPWLYRSLANSVWETAPDFIITFFLVLWSAKDKAIFAQYVLSPSWASYLCILGISLGGLYCLMFTRSTHDEPDKEIYPDSTTRNSASTTPSFMKPLLFPCRTSHTRTFPQKHSFSYSYLLVGVPIGYRGRFGRFLSLDETPLVKSMSYIGIRSADHLQRGDDDSGLHGKLSTFLQEQSDNLEKYPHVYLVTAPRFFGYSFNPVSFWYLYDRTRRLKAMILEVNNTFDERRMYLLRNEEGGDSPGQPEDLSDPEKFRHGWAKDFHVSPFNSRKGSYSLASLGLSVSDWQMMPRIDNTITLSSSKGHAKLVAKVHSTGPALDPSDMTFAAKLQFVASWWWVGFVTFPRIVREAGKLFFRRGLHVWYRPEVLHSSLGRKATAYERVIADVFERYFRENLDRTNNTINVGYEPLVFATPVRCAAPSACVKPRTTLRPLTPQFFTDIARADETEKGMIEAIERSSDPSKATIYTSDPKELIEAFRGISKDCLDHEFPIRTWTWQWHLLSFLRRSKSSEASGPQSHHLSSLDKYALRSVSPSDAANYRKAVLSLLLSQKLYITFGSVEMLQLYLLAMRLGLCWVNAILLSQSIAMEFSIERQTSGYVGLIGQLTGMFGVHLWSALGKSL